MEAIIKETTVKEYNVKVVRLNNPVVGGFYKVVLLCLGVEVSYKDGLCLGASLELFNTTVKSVENHYFNAVF